MHRFGLSVVALAVLLASVAVASSGGATQAEARWAITDLGTLGGHSTSARAINDRGQIVGMSQIANGRWHGFIWQEGTMLDLDPLPGQRHSSAEAINERGEVVGYSTNSSLDRVPLPEWGDGHAILWQGIKPRDLGVLRAGTYSLATAINERGQIIGESEIRGTEERHAFVWQRGKMTDLGTLGGSETFAVAISDRGWIVGFSDIKRDRGSHAFLWRGGRMQDLGVLPPWTQDELESWAVAINESGQVVGDMKRQWNSDYVRAFRWQSGKMTDLGNLGGHWSRPIVINERGQIIGQSRAKYGWKRAFLWQSGRMRDLGTLGGSESKANAINERGQIVGRADTKAKREDGSGIGHGFLWQNDKMTDLGTLGGEESEAVAINERGQIIGWSDTEEGRVAVLWTRVWELT